MKRPVRKIYRKYSGLWYWIQGGLSISPFSGYQSHCVAFYLNNDYTLAFMHKYAGKRALSGMKQLVFMQCD